MTRNVRKMAQLLKDKKDEEIPLQYQIRTNMETLLMRQYSKRYFQDGDFVWLGLGLDAYRDSQEIRKHGYPIGVEGHPETIRVTVNIKMPSQLFEILRYKILDASSQ